MQRAVFIEEVGNIVEWNGCSAIYELQSLVNFNCWRRNLN